MRDGEEDVRLDAELCTAVIDGFDGYFEYEGPSHDVFINVRLRMIDRMYDGVGGRVRESLNSLFWDAVWN